VLEDRLQLVVDDGGTIDIFKAANKYFDVNLYFSARYIRGRSYGGLR